METKNTYKILFCAVMLLFSISTILFAQKHAIGDVIVNANDGSKGVVFWIDSTGCSGWMVALQDIQNDIAWTSVYSDVQKIPNLSQIISFYSSGPIFYLSSNEKFIVMDDTAGYAYTKAMQAEFNTVSSIVDVVPISQGWYIPAVGQLRRLYGALPFISSVIIAQGGQDLEYNNYWSSSEYSASNAITVNFGTGKIESHGGVN